VYVYVRTRGCAREVRGRSLPSCMCLYVGRDRVAEIRFSSSFWEWESFFFKFWESFFYNFLVIIVIVSELKELSLYIKSFTSFSLQLLHIF